MKRANQKLSGTERKVLDFLWMKEFTDEKNYFTYASDPQLLKFTKKSRPQLHRVLRRLERRWGVLKSSSSDNLRGTPVFFNIPYGKDAFRALKKLLGSLEGDILALYIHDFIQHRVNPMPSYILAARFNISKRTAQRRIAKLVKEGLLTKTKKIRRCRDGKYRSRAAYGIPKEKPLTHWMEDK